MHTVHAIDITDDISLTCIQTSKFKTGTITINLIGALRPETAASSALLPRVLRRGTEGHPDMDSLATALDELYGASINPIVRKKGELHCIGFHVDFPDDTCIPAGGNILEKTISLAGEILLDPVKDSNLLKQDYIDSERKNLIDDIRSAINDKRGYSIDRLIEEMCTGEYYATNRLGKEEEALLITPETLMAHYRKQITMQKMQVQYCGAAEPERVASAIQNALRNLPDRNISEMPTTNVILSPPTETSKEISEVLDVSQGKLAIGFRLGKDLKTDLDYPAMMVFNSIYGAGVTSKLFVNVREKLALCYYAGSMIDKHKGIMIVSSGIDSANYNVALDEILAQLGHVKNGNISNDEMKSAITSVTTAIKSSMDRPSGLMELYFDSAVSPEPYDPETLCDKIEAVTLDRVVDCAAEIKTDTIYFLTGQEDEDEI